MTTDPLHVVVVQGVSLWDQLALSTYLRSFLRAMGQVSNLKVSAIVANSTSRPGEGLPGINAQFVDVEVYSPASQLTFARQAFEQLKGIDRKAKVDVVHCLYPNSSLMAAARFRRATHGRAKILYDVRSPWIRTSLLKGRIPQPIRRLYVRVASALERILAFNVDGFVFITDELRDELQPSLYPSATTWVSPSGVDVGAFAKAAPASRSEIGCTSDDVVLGYVGVLSNERELDEFFRLFDAVAAKDPRLRLVIIGDGAAKAKLEAAASNLSHGKRITFLGARPHAEVTRLVHGFDWGVCHLPNVPAFWTSFPMKILEYRAANVPVLASRMEAHERIATRVSGVWIYDSPESLQAILAVARPPPSDLQMYDWSTIAWNYSKWYSSLRA